MIFVAAGHFKVQMTFLLFMGWLKLNVIPLDQPTVAVTWSCWLGCFFESRRWVVIDVVRGGRRQTMKATQ